MVPKGLLLLVLSVLLAGCGLLSPNMSTVEASIAERLRDPTARAQSAPTILRNEPIPRGGLVVFRYDAENADGHPVTAYGMAEVERQGAAWFTTFSMTFVPDLAHPLPAFEMVPFGSAAAGYAAAGGYLADPAVQSVLVTLSDGTSTRVPVDRGVYVAVNPGRATVTKVEAMDADGRVLHTKP